ncbi:MAG: VanZ family protein [Pseudomonadota bacterium]
MRVDPGGAVSAERSIPYRALAMLACLSALFVIYGSLLPFEYRDAPPGFTFGDFSYLNWTNPENYNQVDWVTNLILYVPIGFFAFGATSRQKSGGAILAALLGASLAICIEFLQIWAAPRTASLNDIVANITGAGAGILGWALWGRLIVSAVQNTLSGGPKTLTAGLGLYLLVYSFIALFPFDFLVSADEIATRLADPKAFVWAPENLLGVRSLASLILKIALILPLGMAIKLIWNRGVASAVLAAFVLTGGIEALQWLEYSGRVEASSFAIAILGAALGHQITDLLPKIMLRLTPWLKAGIWLAAPLYLAILPVLRGWHAGFAGQSKIEDVLASMHWMPFHYYYFTTVPHAFSSLLSLAVSYAPLGVFIWAIRILKGKAAGERQPLGFSAFVAIIFAGVIEVGGLTTTGLRPDLTNILIAVAAVMLTQRFCGWAARLGSDLSIPESKVQVAPQDRPFAKINAQSAMHFVTQRPALIPYAFSLLAITLWFIVDFPILRLPIAAAFTLYAIFLWRRPMLWLVAVPALLPVFDLAPWSGRFFFDEFDALVLLTAGILALRENGAEPPPPLSRNLKLVLTLLALSYLLSSLIQLWPPPPITPNSFADYFSPYNSLRVGKGFVWALLLFNPLRRAMTQDSDAMHLLLRGLLLGLFGVSVVGVCEHWIFAGLFEWNSDHRIAATFSSMHTGDGPIDVWLAVSIPLLGILLLDRRWWALLPVTIGMGLLSFYTLMATASRGPFIAIIIAYGAGMLGLLATRPGWRRGFITVALGLGSVVLISVVGVPMLSRTYMGERFEGTASDAETRYNHWRAALNLRDDTFATKVLGMGLGSFPRINQASKTIELRSSRIDFIRDGADGFIRMWSGMPQYMFQAIDIDADSAYQVSVRLRTSEPNASLTVALCDKWLISSYNCTYAMFQIQENSEEWQTYKGKIKTGKIGHGGSVSGLAFPRPTRLSFWINNAPLHGVDIDAISITNENEINLVANDEFAQLSDRWFWTTDAHMEMHTKNLVVGLLIDQGWLGLLAVGALLALTLAALARQIAAGDRLAAVLLAALTGFLVTGMTVSTFDQPRLVLMFYILCLTIIFRPAKAAGGTHLPGGNHSGQSSPAS